MATPKPGETVEDFARRLLAEHGPPPDRIRDQVVRLKRRAARLDKAKRPA